jgi:hypothetical protein
MNCAATGTERAGEWGSVSNSDSVIQLAKFLGMLGSNHDGEVLNAARIAERFRKTLDKTWIALLTGAQSNDLPGAEARVLAAEQYARELESRVAALERKIAAMHAQRAPSGSSARSHSGRSDHSPGNSALGHGIQLALRSQGVTLAELRQLSCETLGDADTLWWVMFKDCERYGYRFWATKFRGDHSRAVYHLERIF